MGPGAKLSTLLGQTVWPWCPTVQGLGVWGPTVWGSFCQEPIGLPLVVGKLGLDNLKHECLGPIYVKLGGEGGSVLPQLAKFGNKI